MSLTKKGGNPHPFGAFPSDDGYNFAFFGQAISRAFLHIFLPSGSKVHFELDPVLNKSEEIWHAQILPLTAPFEYLIEIERDGKRLFLQDPFGERLSGVTCFGQKNGALKTSVLPKTAFNWGSIQNPNLPLSDLIIYEMHVRSFTAGSCLETRGTFEGLIDKLDWIANLGITAIELMPIFFWDEMASKPAKGSQNGPLPNVWGYSPLSFLAIMPKLAMGDPDEGLKKVIYECHKRKIEVIIDVVYNHTGEGKNHIHSLWGLAKEAYYLFDKNHKPLNFSGCGNTIHSSHAMTQELILTSLRRLALEFHVDGFRFDLGAALCHGSDGSFSDLLLQKIADDPQLASCKLFAEPWDAKGLYLFSSFPRSDRFIVWNDHFRDRTRRFVNGFCNSAQPFAQSFTGSTLPCDRYPLGVFSTVHMVTCHDGFSLYDLVSYNQKHNLANGELNRDGQNHNWSSNCGVEGETKDPKILSLRNQIMRYYLAILLFSRGIPLIWMGDEIAMSRKGNNNPWNQDALNFFPWDKSDINHPQYLYIKEVIALRKKIALFHIQRFLKPEEIHFHGTDPHNFAWHSEDRFIAIRITLQELPLQYYFAINSFYEPLSITLPEGNWELCFSSTPLKEPFTIPAYTLVLMACPQNP